MVGLELEVVIECFDCDTKALESIMSLALSEHKLNCGKRIQTKRSSHWLIHGRWKMEVFRFWLR